MTVKELRDYMTSDAFIKVYTVNDYGKDVVLYDEYKEYDGENEEPHGSKWESVKDEIVDMLWATFKGHDSIINVYIKDEEDW